MPLENPSKEGEDRPEEPEVECSMCHQRVRFSQSVAMSGRRLCFGCAAAWYDEDDQERDS